MNSHRSLALALLLTVFSVSNTARAARTIYWTDKDAARIQYFRLDGGGVEDLLTSADGLAAPYGIAVDPYRGRMYWADSGTGKIREANLDGSGARDFATGLQFPADLAIDLWNDKLYWAERDANRIRRANLDGTGSPEDVVTTATLPYYIELDLVAGHVYWSESDNSVIYRVPVDGSGPLESIVTGLDRVRDIAVDIPGGRLYWCDRDTSKIQRKGIEGVAPPEDLYTAVDGLDRPHGLALDPTSGTLYWTDTITQAIHRGNMDGSSAAETLAPGLTGPWGIVIHEDPPRPGFRSGVVVGSIEEWQLDEASGLVASRANPGVLWSHNDHGDASRVFALSDSGRHLGIFFLSGITLDDPEAIGIGPGPSPGLDYLYVGDIGDNDEVLASVAVHRVLEPTVDVDQQPVLNVLSNIETLRLRYAAGPRNAEAMIVDPDNGDIYLITKHRAPTEVWRAAYPQSTTDTTTMVLVATFNVDWRSPAVIPVLMGATDASISPEGNLILVRSYWLSYLWERRPGEELWRAFNRPPIAVPSTSTTGDPWFEEAICFDAQSRGYFTVSEGPQPPIYYYARIGQASTASMHWAWY